jgi:methyl-accepting chemotaxis protein
MAERVDRMITQIAIAASQQADAANQSSSSLDSIHTLSQDNLTETATTTAGIESLRATAAALERQVERFRLDTPQPGLAARRASPRPRPIPYPTPTRALSS